MKKMHTSAVGAPTSDPLDTVHLYLEQDELVIAPANILPEEALLRPVLPVDGGWLCVELRTQSGDDINFGYMGGVVDSDDVPLWVELVYGHAVVEAARALLGSSGTDRSQGNAVVETRWHSEPTETTRCLVRLAMGDVDPTLLAEPYRTAAAATRSCSAGPGAGLPVLAWAGAGLLWSRRYH